MGSLYPSSAKGDEKKTVSAPASEKSVPVTLVLKKLDMYIFHHICADFFLLTSNLGEILSSKFLK